MFDDEVVKLGIELDFVISLVRVFLEDKREVRLLFTHSHLNEIVVLQEVELFESLLEVMDSAEELSCNTDIFEAEVSVKRVSCLVRVEANDGLLYAALFSTTRVFWNLDLEEVVADRVLEL